MTKRFPKRIREALARKDLIPYEKVLSQYSFKEQREIAKRTRYLKAAMELRRLRKELRLSQDELAKKVQVKREFISRIESGRQNVTLETLYRIADVVGKNLQLSFR